MPDRRRDNRYGLTEPIDGVLRTFLDVVVQRTARDEWMGLGREAAVIGETLVLDVAPTHAGAAEAQTMCVQVTDSQPVIIDGEVRHRIRLRRDDLTLVLLELEPKEN